LWIRPEADLGTAPIGCAAGLFQFAFRLAALESHPIELLLARDFDFHAFRQGVGDGDADAMQAA
jgi:hypothetical protein